MGIGRTLWELRDLLSFVALVSVGYVFGRRIETRHFAELPKPDRELQARLNDLASKANEGALSAEEAVEYDKYVEYMDFVAYMRLKARARACP